MREGGGRTEIAQSNMSCVVQQNIFRFEITLIGIGKLKPSARLAHIPIYDIETMQMFQGAQKFCCIESTSVLIELALALQVIEQFSAVDWMRRPIRFHRQSQDKRLPKDITR